MKTLLSIKTTLPKHVSSVFSLMLFAACSASEEDRFETLESDLICDSGNPSGCDLCDFISTHRDGLCDISCRESDPDCRILPPKTCGDGSTNLCGLVESACLPGLVYEVVDHCVGRCVDPNTCQPPIDLCDYLSARPNGKCVPFCADRDPDCKINLKDTCGDGSMLACKAPPPTCQDGLVPEIVDGCYGRCVDPDTCVQPKPSSHTNVTMTWSGTPDAKGELELVCTNGNQRSASTDVPNATARLNCQAETLGAFCTTSGLRGQTIKSFTRTVYGNQTTHTRLPVPHGATKASDKIFIPTKDTVRYHCELAGKTQTAQPKTAQPKLELAPF